MIYKEGKNQEGRSVAQQLGWESDEGDNGEH